MKINITLTVNEKEVNTDVEQSLSLLRFLREELHLIGTKNGCEEGHCGTCTVIVNGEAKRSCLLSMSTMQGAVIETIENLNQHEKLHYIQQAYIEEGAVQCGFCTPGMIMATKALLDRNANPSEQEIKNALKYNLCRCTGYSSIIKAVQRAVVLKTEQKEVVQTTSRDFMGYIGVSVVRKDVSAKVKGKVVFADDYTDNNMLYGKLLCSEHAHAKILSIDIEQAQKAPGVALILTAKDIPGRNAFGLFYAQQPVIAEKKVKYLGEVVAAVFAETREQAEYARSLIKVQYEVLPPILSPLESIKQDAPLIHQDKENNIVHHVKVRKGDVEKGFAKADVIVEGYYYTPAVEHAYLEPEACLARPEADGGVTVWTASQGSITFQDAIAKSLAIPIEKVRVIYTPCGGGFGGKEEPTVQIHAALAAVKTNRAVKIVLTRQESIRISTKRHPMHIWMKHGASKDGKFVAMESKVIADAGSYISMTMPVIFRSAVTASGPYEIENVKADSYGVYTHNNPAGAFRGFGSTQASFAAEIQMDKLAKELKIDAVELRKLNGFAPGKITSTGQILAEGVEYFGTLEVVKTALDTMKEDLQKEERPAYKKLGFGLASSYKNVGIGTGKLDKAGAIIEITEAGRVLVKIGAAEMGQGVDTIAAQIAATVLEIPYKLVNVIACDTAQCPDGGMTTASRQTYVTGNAVKKAAEQFKQMLNSYQCIDNGEEITQQNLCDIYIKAKQQGQILRVEAEYIPPKTYPHRECADHDPKTRKEEFDIHYAYCFATAGVAVEVDTLSGEVKVLKVAAAQDVGKAIHPQNVKGQIEGAVVMGIGFALTEEFVETNNSIITDNLRKLHIPNIIEAPSIEAVIIEREQPEGPFGAKGMGEVGLNPIAPAISNAIFDAVGIRLQSLPMKKEKVLAALKEGGRRNGKS